MLSYLDGWVRDVSVREICDCAMFFPEILQRQFDIYFSSATTPVSVPKGNCGGVSKFTRSRSTANGRC